MPTLAETVNTYRELAEIYESRKEAQMRDRFLVLAADAALTAGRTAEAERLRGVLLQHNPHHLLKPYASLAEALKSADIRNYVAALRRSHPYERAAQLLATLSGRDDEGAHLRGNGVSRVPEQPQVIRIHEAQPAAPPAREEKPISPARPAIHERPQPAPEVFRLRPEPAMPRHFPPEPASDTDDKDSIGSFWIATLLAVLIGAAGLVLAAHTFLQPWLPY
jgi:hypothetical protein